MVDYYVKTYTIRKRKLDDGIIEKQINSKNMKSISAKYFECTCKYRKINENGQERMTTETNVVDALSFSEAEGRFIEEMKPYINGEFEVTSIKVAPYKEVFFSDKESDDRWYKVKIALIAIDEKTGKEKRTNVYYLVQAATLNGAIKNINEAIGSTMMDYISIAATETKIWEVFTYNKNTED